MSEWRKSRAAAAVVIAVFILIQLAVPISRLGSGNPARFGWQMYSSAEPSPQFTVETADTEFEVDVDDYVAARRVEIDITAHMPVHLCAVVEGALRVTWVDGEYSC